MQSIIRGYLARAQLAMLNAHAVVIQRYRRGYSMTLMYAFALMGIILIQGLRRRKRAKNEVAVLQRERRARTATIIQAQHRGDVMIAP